MEAAGIEPASEKEPTKTSTYVAYWSMSLLNAPIDKAIQKPIRKTYSDNPGKLPAAPAKAAFLLIYAGLN